jgi:hypothetical protein
VRSEILGGILALVQGYLRDGIPKKGEASEFRMTTYASVGKYVAETLSLNSDFASAYRANQLGMSRNSLEAEPITDFIIWFAKKYGDKELGSTPAERGNQTWGVDKKSLYDIHFNEWRAEKIDKIDFGDGKKFPRTASKLLAKIKRIAPDLKRIYGIEVKNTGIHKAKDWMTIKQVRTVNDLNEEKEYPGEEEYDETKYSQSNLGDKKW